MGRKGAGDRRLGGDGWEVQPREGRGGGVNSGGAGLGAGLGAGPGRDAGGAARFPPPRLAPRPSRWHSCGAGGGRGAEWRDWKEAVLSLASGRREPVVARRRELEVAGPGEATMKPSSEDEAGPAGGPWEECFEAAVQLALRAGQVSGTVLLPRPAGSQRAQSQRTRPGGSLAAGCPLKTLQSPSRSPVGREGDPPGLGAAGPAQRAAAGLTPRGERPAGAE